MTLPKHVIEAIHEQARRDHKPDPQRWQAVIATARVMRNMDNRKTLKEKGNT